MPETTPVKSEKVFEVGPDRVRLSETEAVIEARRPIPDWDVREMNHVPIYLEDRKYYLIEKKKAERPYSVRYLLHPWPATQATNARGFLVYDAESVKEREGQVRSGHFEELTRAFLMPLYPLLGLLWSGTQKRLIRFGFVPHSITGFSVFTIFSLVFGQGVFAVILLNTSLRSGKIMVGGFLRALASSDQINLGPVGIPVTVLDILLLVVLVVDILVRYSHYLRDDQWAGGFFEWVVPRRKKAIRPAATMG